MPGFKRLRPRMSGGRRRLPQASARHEQGVFRLERVGGLVQIEAVPIAQVVVGGARTSAWRFRREDLSSASPAGSVFRPSLVAAASSGPEKPGASGLHLGDKEGRYWNADSRTGLGEQRAHGVGGDDPEAESPRLTSSESSAASSKVRS